MHILACLGTLALALIASLPASAQSQTFSATVAETPYTSELLVYYADGHPYLPLLELARELGGSGRIATPTEAEVTIGGQRAVLFLNNVRYEVGGNPADLQRPFLAYESEVLVPQDEAIAFVQAAFGIALTEGAAAAPTPEPEAMLLDESAALLETDAIAAPVAETPAEDATPLAFKTIVLDPGHGGNDAGAQGPGGTLEKDVCLAVANKVAEALKADTRIKVVVLRTDDSTLSITERARLAAQEEGAFLVSIHTGASFVPSSNGVEVFYPSDYSRSRVAGARERAAAETLGQALASESGASLRGVMRAPLRLFRAAELPGCLVEVGCLSNPEEEQQLASAAYQDRIARGLTRGIQQLAGAE